MRYEITLPLPPKSCSPNHHPVTVRAKIAASRERAAYRSRCADAYKKAGVPPAGVVTIHLEYFLYRGRPRTPLHWLNSAYAFPKDDDNAIGCFKAGRDALQDAGIVPDDTPAHVKMGAVILHATAPDHRNLTYLKLTLVTKKGTPSQ